MLHAVALMPWESVWEVVISTQEFLVWNCCHLEPLILASRKRRRQPKTNGTT